MGAVLVGSVASKIIDGAADTDEFVSSSMKTAFIANDAGETIWIGRTSAETTLEAGFPIRDGETFIAPLTNNGQIWAISVTDDLDIRVMILDLP